MEDAEAPMLGQQQWEAVHVRHAQGQTMSAIARELDLDPKTARTCLRQSSWQPYPVFLRFPWITFELRVHRDASG
jgi:hypothetical protein